MIAGIATETFPGERRVAMIPAVVPSLQKLGCEVLLEAGAGAQAGFTDAAYREKGAKIVASRGEVFALADVVLQVRSLASSRTGPKPLLGDLRTGQTVVGFLDPIAAPEGVQALAERGVTAFALDLVPRISRAQAMDALSSVATVMGYKAVLLAADTLPRMFPMMMTAAGTLAPAKVFVIGGGVAGLQAIATARRLGAVVQAYDIRPAVKEQVESLGARFVELPLDVGDSQDAGGYAKAMDDTFLARQRELMGKVIAQSDVVIATASVPGKQAPVLVTRQMVEGMHPGSVIVDVAAEQGGNCEVTRAGETVQHAGVSVIGPLNISAQVPNHASQMLARNVANFLALIVKKGELSLDLSDPIVFDTLVARAGAVVNPRIRTLLGLPELHPANP